MVFEMVNKFSPFYELEFSLLYSQLEATLS